MAKTMTKAQEVQRAEMVKVWGDDLHMVEYVCKSSTPYMINEKEFIAIKKPKIETRFCFGYGMGYEYEDAEKMRERCEKSVNYFKRKNTEDMERIIKLLKESERKAYKQIHYIRGEKEIRIFIPYNRATYEQESRANNLTELSENERAAALAAYEKELQKFNKRLDTYLKRYGLSKLKTWTYWEDA